MEYKGKMMEKEGQIPKNTLKNLPARSARWFITLKKNYFSERGGKLFFWNIYTPGRALIYKLEINSSPKGNWRSKGGGKLYIRDFFCPPLDYDLPPPQGGGKLEVRGGQKKISAPFGCHWDFAPPYQNLLVRAWIFIFIHLNLYSKVIECLSVFVCFCELLYQLSWKRSLISSAYTMDHLVQTLSNIKKYQILEYRLNNF